jgi:hypothetical protein
MRLLLLYALLAAAFLAMPRTVGVEQGPGAIETEAQLNEAIAQLKRAKTRLSALDQLLSFGSLKLYNVGSVIFSTGNAAQDRLIQKAADAARRCNDFDTIRLALLSPKAGLQFWALWNIPSKRKDSSARWAALETRIKELAKGKDAGIRGQAQECLEGLGEHEAFLKECIETETCLDNIMRPLYGQGGPAFFERLNPHVIRLLASNDKDVRRAALGFIGFNRLRAEMWQINFSSQVFQRVMELSRSEIGEERASAVSALGELRNQDPVARRKRLVEMVSDESEDVRWRIPLALADQLEHEDVGAAMERLLRDKSAVVRYFTILELGAEHHVRELEELANGTDRKIAEWATKTLDGLRAKKK